MDGLGHVVDVLAGQATHVDAATRHQVDVLLLDEELDLLSWGAEGAEMTAEQLGDEAGNAIGRGGALMTSAQTLR